MKNSRRHTLKMAALGGLILATGGLAGCGFQPVYGDFTRSGADVTKELEGIRVSVSSGREGQILQNFLLDRFNPNGRPANPTATISSELTVDTANLGTQIDETTVRSRITVSVRSTLSESATGEAWLFTSEAVVGYPTTEDVYASQVAEDGALKQALRAVADDLRIQVATFYEKRRLIGG